MISTLQEALAYFLANDPVILSSFVGVYTSTIPPGIDLPNISVIKTGTEPTGVIGPINGMRAYIDKVTIDFEVRAAGGDQADLLLETLRTELLRRQTPLGWAGGIECGRWLAGGESSELEEQMGPNGCDVWVTRLPMGFTITRNS